MGNCTPGLKGKTIGTITVTICGPLQELWYNGYLGFSPSGPEQLWYNGYLSFSVNLRRVWGLDRDPGQGIARGWICTVSLVPSCNIDESDDT